MSKEKTVITVNGIECPISNCRRFERGYYLIGQTDVLNSGDCYLINGKYYREEIDQVVFDFEQSQYVLKNDTVLYGVIGFVDKSVEFGHFTKSIENVEIFLEGGSKSILRHVSLLKDQKQYREKLADGIFYHISLMPATAFNKISVPTADYKTSLPYDSGGVLAEYVDTYNKLNPLININVDRVTPILKDLSLGLEFETTAGFLPKRILDKTGLVPLRDGSIPGIEYVTVPVMGAKGLQTIVNATKELNARTTYDTSCALHLHIGNVPRTPEFILAMFKITCTIQNEMYEYFPLYKKYNFSVKNKNYSKPYNIFDLVSQLDPIINASNLSKNFDVLYQHLSMGDSFQNVGNDLRNVKVHPADREGRAKWNIKTRYYLNNFIPLIFGNKQTIEFRIHTATVDTSKIMYFILINAMLVNFTIENTTQILQDPKFLIKNSNLVSIIKYQIHSAAIKSNSFRSTILRKIVDYLAVRKENTYHESCKGDFVGNEDKIRVPNVLDWLTVIDPAQRVLILIEELKLKLETTIKGLRESSMITKKTILDQHLAGRLSQEDARRQLSVLEDKIYLVKRNFKQEHPEIVLEEEELTW